MSGCYTCGGGMGRHDPIAHDQGEPCEHEWIEQGGPGDEWRECDRCGLIED